MKKKMMMGIMTVFMCTLLTGCMGMVANTTVKSDGSGTMILKSGISEMSKQMIESMSQDGTDSILTDENGEQQEMTSFTHNGKTYYGSIETITFSSAEDFNEKWKQNKEDEEFDTGVFELIKNSDGTFNLNFKVTTETANTSEAEDSMTAMELPEEQINLLMQDMVMEVTFNMPSKVTQTAGSNKGITINNNVIKIDLLKLDLPTDANKTFTYTFTTQNQTTPKPQTSTTQRFTDVPLSLWSYNAITALAEGGLVSGVGEGRFSPERGMKISEFCQVLANATGLESGADESGYWAAKAIKSCIDKGYIYSHGEIKIEIYDEIITREEAIAAMQLASGRAQRADSNITIEDIPDGDQISEKYKALVLQAYNSGITTGVNEQLKFSPKNQLTRGQVCQLFYNVNWITPIKK